MEICYDLRFPEMHRLLVEKGAKVLLFPAAFTIPTGRDHWRECYGDASCVKTGADCCLSRHVTGKCRAEFYLGRTSFAHLLDTTDKE